VERIEKAGGKVVKPRTAVPGHGHFAVCRDTEKNIFAIWEG
jgi:predicted enzyme related to lactoylglutathione lyase